MQVKCKDCGKEIQWSSLNADRCMDCWNILTNNNPPISISQAKRIDFVKSNTKKIN